MLSRMMKVGWAGLAAIATLSLGAAITNACGRKGQTPPAKPAPVSAKVSPALWQVHLSEVNQGEPAPVAEWTVAELATSIAGLGMDIPGVDHEAKTVDVLVYPWQESVLLQVYPNAKKSAVQVADQVADSRYKTPETVISTLYGIARKYPGMVDIAQIGQTHKERPIMAARLGSREENKKVIVFDAMHHARELMTPEVALDIIEQLASGSDPELDELLKTVEVWVVPQVNPDGNNLVWTANTMQRKNANPSGHTDNNRNYPWKWGQCGGSSGTVSNEQYRGRSANSEPETKAMVELGRMLKGQLKMYISYHSYSEMVLLAGGCQGERTSPEQRAFGQELGRLHKRDRGGGPYAVGQSWELLYPTDGVSADWFAGELGAYAYVIELNGSSAGFQPPYSYRDPTVQMARAGWKAAIKKTSTL